MEASHPAVRSAAHRPLRSVANALTVLEVLADAGAPLGVSEIARRAGVPVSTAHRLLATLEFAGFVRHERQREYRLGPAVARIAIGAAPPPLMRDAARPLLRWLAEASGESVHLALLDGLSVISVEHVRGSRPGDVAHVAGARVPAHATAVGLALLAHHPRVVEALVDAGLDRWTTVTPVDAASLRRQLDGVVRRGYAVNVRGWMPGTAGVAAPVLHDGDAVAAIGISGPAERLGRRATLAQVGPLVRAAALALSARLAESPPPHPHVGEP